MSIEQIKQLGRHHAFAKSDYFKPDRDEDWNLFDLSADDHEAVTNGGNDEEIERGRAIDKKCKLIAIARYKGKYMEKLFEVYRARYGRLPDE